MDQSQQKLRNQNTLTNCLTSRTQVATNKNWVLKN